jgi:hypothetical protein
MRKIERTIIRFHKQLLHDRHHRYRSWSHCYHYFKRREQLRTRDDLDESAIRLGFYLASWGMYRGSGFLLWKDYRIHLKVVRELMRPEHDSLLGFKPASNRDDGKAPGQIVSLSDSIREAYCSQIKSVNGHRSKIRVTDTLITKILLGTLACVPAYDEYVVKGMRAEGLSYTTLEERNLNALFKWYTERGEEFRSVQRRIVENKLSYPPMKLVDMYFWQLGLERGRRYKKAKR